MTVKAKYQFYKSRHNGSIHPANTSSPGYEDDHRADWIPVEDSLIESEVQPTALGPQVAAPSSVFAGVSMPPPFVDEE